ncbi:MAG: EAL domain-containing protein [Planctomycetota bacterium]|nr:EAL domain-containing protein [Planctomycetota bacterium]
MRHRDQHLELSEFNLRRSEVRIAKAKILLIDSDHVSRDADSRLLTKNHYTVETAESAAGAIDRLGNSFPDLVVLNFNLPEQNEVELLRQIRRQYSESLLPVVVLAAESGVQPGVAVFRAGANDFLLRPFENDILLARVSLQLRHRHSHVELQSSQQRYSLAAQGAQIGLWDLDIVRQKIFLSSRWKELLGFTDVELDSTIPVWLDRMHPDDRESLITTMNTTDSLEGGRFDCELRMQHRDDSYRWMLCSGVTQTDAHGNILRLAGSLADVTEGKVRDVLTGLPNRLLFEEQLQKIIDLDQGNHGLSAVLFLDLDDFKRINDTHGHDAGDLLLCSVARRLEGCLRESDVIARQKSGWSIARHGGDEFTILLHQLQSRADAEFIAERIIIALAESFLIGVREVLIGVSVGIAFGGIAGKTPADSIREADTAMYYAKTSGRGRYCIFSPEMQAGATAKLALEDDLRQAIRSHQFFLVYQPIVRLSSGRIEGFEALCRWKHPRGEKVGPDVFVPLIESLGLTSRLGRAIFEEACEEVLKWNDLSLGGPAISVTVNCSPEEFSQPSFKHDLLMTMTNVGIDPQTLKLEVNEGAFHGKPEQTRAVMNELRDLGIRIGIDDFGTGFSSLAFLHRIPLDLLKIDHSFVHKILSCSETRDIVRTIISLAQNLNLDIVAEGVESADQRDLLYEMGCTHAQGYLYSQPMPGPDVPDILAMNQKTQSVPRAISTRDSESSRIEAQLQNLDDLMRQR